MNDVSSRDRTPDDADLAARDAWQEELGRKEDLGGGGHLAEVVSLFTDNPRKVSTPQTPPLIRASELLAREMKPRPWLVRDVIPGKQVCELRGDGGTGKSTLGLQLCVAAATGRSWLDMPVARGPAIYLAAEDDEDEIQRRLDAIAVHLGVAVDALSDLHVWPLASDDPALVARVDGDFGATPRWEQLEAFVRRLRPVVIVLDSRADVFGGEEINRQQVRAFVALLRKLAVRTGAAVIILAHPSVAGLANGSGNSGSTHWTNAVRAALNFQKLKDAEGSDPDLRTLEVVKNNYARGSSPTTLRWSAGAFVVAEGGTKISSSRAEATARVDQLFLELLARYEVEGRRVGGSFAGNYAPKVFAEDPDANGTTKAAFAAAMGRLFKAGTVVMETSGSPKRPVRRLVIAPDR